MYLQIEFWSAQVYIYICTLSMYGSVLKIGAFTRSRMSALGWPWLDWCASSPWLWRARQRNTTKQCKAWTVNSAQCFVPSASRAGFECKRQCLPWRAAPAISIYYSALLRCTVAAAARLHNLSFVVKRVKLKCRPLERIWNLFLLCATRLGDRSAVQDCT